MFKEVLLSQVGAGITHISGYIEDLILEAGQGFFESKVEREKLQKLLTEYIERHEKYNEICTLAEEIDFEGLVIYIQSQMLEDFRNTIFDTNTLNRDKTENRIIQRAIAYAKADTEEAKKRVTKMLKELIEMTRGFFLCKIPIEERILASTVVEEVGSIIGTGAQSIVTRLKETNLEVVNSLSSLQKGADEIKRLLMKDNHYLDDDSLVKVYKQFKALFVRGEIHRVNDLKKLINKENQDLFYSVDIMYALVCDDAYDIYASFTCIKNEEISNDLARFILLSYISDVDVLTKMKSAIYDEALKEIYQRVIQKEWTKIVIVSEVSGEPSFIRTIKINNEFPQEEMLIRRLSLCWLIENRIGVGYKQIIELFGPNMTWWEELFANQVFIVDYERGIVDDAKYLSDIVEKYQSIRMEYCGKYKNGIDKAFYLTLISAIWISENDLSLAADRILRFYDDMNDSIANIDEIKCQRMQALYKSGQIGIREVAEECSRVGMFWPFTNILADQDSDEEMILEIIEDYKFLLGKDVHILMYYVSSMKNRISQQEILKILNKWKNTYENHIKYWLLKDEYDNFSNTFEIYDQWKNNKFGIISLNDGIVLSLRLKEDSFFNESEKVLLEMKKIYGDVYELNQLLIRLYCNTGKILKAIPLLEKLFEIRKTDPFVIGTLIECSLNSGRNVRDDVVSAANKSQNPAVKAILAMLYERENKHDLAIANITEALLLKPDAPAEWYRRYFAISVHVEKQSVPTSTFFVDDMVAVFSNDRDTVIYGLLSENILTITDELRWNGVIFISKYDSIKKGFYRKQVGDIVKIEGIDFKLVELMPFSTYVFRVSAEKMISAGYGHSFSIDTSNDKMQELHKLVTTLKPYIGESQNKPIQEYQDFNNAPMPFVYLARSLGAEYGQFVRALLRDQNYIVRDIFSHSLDHKKKYILSYSAVAALQIIGGSQDDVLKKDVVIASSTAKGIQLECEELIKSYSRERVGRIAIIDDQIQYREANDLEKEKTIEEAVILSEYISKIPEIINTEERDLNGIKSTELKELLGIPDYDTAQIAITEDRSIVSTETIITELGILDDKISTTNLVDFIVECDLGEQAFFKCLESMIQFKMVIFISPKVMVYVSKLYESAKTEDDKERILSKWIDMLFLYESIEDDSYKEIFFEAIVQASRDMMERNENVNSIIMFHLALFVIRISKNNSSSLLDYNEMSIKIKEAIMVDEANE